MSEQKSVETFRTRIERYLSGKPARAQVLAAYAAGPEQLSSSVAGLAEADLNLARAPGAWSIRQIAQHVVDGDDIWTVCLKAACGKPGCSYSMGWYDQDAWPEGLDYAGRDLEPALASLAASRRYVVDLLQSIPDAWDRGLTVVWPQLPEGQQTTVGLIVAIQALHVPWHVEQILETLEGRRR